MISKLRPVEWGLLGLSGLLGVLMAASGMAASLAHALAQTGPWYLVVAPWVAGLGGFVTGSNSGANAMLAATQAEIARALGVGLLPFMAVQFLFMFLMVLFPQLVTVPARWFY